MDNRTWPSDTVRDLTAADELQITSYRKDGSLRRWTPIWLVMVGNDVYIRSAYGPDGGWYKWAMRSRRGRIRVGGLEADVDLEPVEDDATGQQVTLAYRAKYSSMPSALRPMVSSPATETTTRLVPTAD